MQREDLLFRYEFHVNYRIRIITCFPTIYTSKNLIWKLSSKIKREYILNFGWNILCSSYCNTWIGVLLFQKVFHIYLILHSGNNCKTYKIGWLDFETR